MLGGGVAGGLTAWSRGEYDARAAANTKRSVDGESVLMPLLHRTEALAGTTAVLLAVGAGTGVVTVASIPVVDFAE